MNSCNKCFSPSTITLRKKDHYCDDCFLAGTNHKFRASIGKNKILSKNDKVLLCISGGPGSTALIDLTHYGINLDIHKKLRIVPYFLHISDKNNVTEAIIKLCEKYNFCVYCVPLSDYFNLHKKLPAPNMIPEEDEDLKNELKDILKSLPATSCNDFIDQAKRNLFLSYAKLLDCKYIFSGEIASSLAAKMLSHLAIGRGSQVQNNIGFIDQRDSIKIIRPMKDISKEELDNYISLKKLTPVNIANTSNNSLQTIISNFVTDLQQNFQSTISTVCKTADKIGSTQENTEPCKQCAICQSNLVNMENKITALEATNISRIMSFGKCIQDSNISNEMFPLVNEELCYSCSKNYLDMKKCNIQSVENIIKK